MKVFKLAAATAAALLIALSLLVAAPADACTATETEAIFFCEQGGIFVLPTGGFVYTNQTGLIPFVVGTGYTCPASASGFYQSAQLYQCGIGACVATVLNVAVLGKQIPLINFQCN